MKSRILHYFVAICSICSCLPTLETRLHESNDVADKVESHPQSSQPDPSHYRSEDVFTEITENENAFPDLEKVNMDILNSQGYQSMVADESSRSSNDNFLFDSMFDEVVPKPPPRVRMQQRGKKDIFSDDAFDQEEMEYLYNKLAVKMGMVAGLSPEGILYAAIWDLSNRMKKIDLSTFQRTMLSNFEELDKSTLLKILRESSGNISMSENQLVAWLYDEML